MRVALLGTRGVPAAYGGFETLAEELGARLAGRGHDVTVYARRGAVLEERAAWRGMRVVFTPTLRHKYLDTVVHGVTSGLHAATEAYDAVLVCNGANALACRLPRLLGSGTRILLNVDGLERNRRKWNRLGKLVYALSERLSCVLPDVVVTDAEEIRRYYRTRYGKESAFVPYGSDLPAPRDLSVLGRLGLEPERYVLYVSRFEPENNPDAVVRAWRSVPGDARLVLVGSAPYAEGFIARLREEAAGDPRVILPGAIYGEGYRALLANAAAYVHATEVGGTHPALVEAMGYGRPVLVHDTPENREVAGSAALFWDAREPATLARQLSALLPDSPRREALGAAARRRAAARYRWDDVAAAYEALLGGLGPDGLPSGPMAC
ncbi:MAG: glycosyltransferase [Thermoanaerobaculia bacterium]|nr:glycosyltransferase [Thermoanaerobaculia bacterium]